METKFAPTTDVLLAEELSPPPAFVDVFQQLVSLPHAIAFDSALSHPTLGRFSYIAADPFDWITARGKQIQVAGQSTPLTGDPFALLQERLALYRMEPQPDLPPFQGGAAGLLGYELAHHLERLPSPRFDDFELPELAVGFYDWVIALDHQQNRAWIVSTGFPELEPEQRRRRALGRLEQVKCWLRARPQATSWRRGKAREVVEQWPTPARADVTSNFSRDDFLAVIRRGIEYIHAGDCFQVNLSQRLLTPATCSPVELYLRLRERNAAPFAGYFDFGAGVLCSASPERFLRLDQGEIEARPIKGTRPVGATPLEDQIRRGELRISRKDWAENIMIVDLLRNDLGRVCQYGSVYVPALCQLETYRYVHHLVSQVRGTLRPEKTAIDLLRAAFPGGSVTGAPKIRAMEIIAELEPTVRGPYCGSLAWLGFDGNMDSSILIRTMTHADGWLQFPVGGGIVADSDPEREYEETWHKAQGLLKALEL